MAGLELRRVDIGGAMLEYRAVGAGEPVVLQECVRCGQTTTGEVCAFCKLADQVRRAGAARPDGTPPGEEEPAALRGLISDLNAATEIHAS